MDLSEITQLPRPELEKLDPGIIKDAILREQRSTNTTVEEDKYHNRLRQISQTVDGYGSLVDREEVSWTYLDAEKGVVDRITVDRGLLEKARTVIRHSLEGKVVEVQKIVIREPIKEPIDASTTH